MATLPDLLERYGLDAFINKHRKKLCEKIIQQRQMAAFLEMTSQQIAEIMHPPGSYAQTENLLEQIQRHVTAAQFIEALDETGNGHVIELINSLLCDSNSAASSQSKSTTTQNNLC